MIYIDVDMRISVSVCIEADDVWDMNLKELIDQQYSLDALLDHVVEKTVEVNQ